MGLGELQKMSSEEQKDTFSRLVFESGKALNEFGLWFLDSKKASKLDA
jgi:hypothetical protein